MAPDVMQLDSQRAKADEGKHKLSLVPSEIIRNIARIREYGNQKYGDPENWRSVDKARYKDAAYRHWLAYIDNPQGIDKESGMPHGVGEATRIQSGKQILVQQVFRKSSVLILLIEGPSWRRRK